MPPLGQSDSRRPLEVRNTEVPGPRVRVMLDVAEASLPALVEGVEGARVWLREQEPGVYSFHATQTVGQGRKQPGTPAIDILTELVNELGDALDGEDVPQHLRDKWDEMVDRYVAQTGKAK